MSAEAEVRLWGRRIAGVLDDPDSPAAVFQYATEFASSPFQVAPLTMPLRTAVIHLPGA